MAGEKKKFTIDCRVCGKIIYPTHVQQDSVHMECTEKEIDIYTIQQNGTRYCVDFDSLKDSLEAMEYDNEEIIIIKRRMTFLEFQNIPEFEGF